MHFDQNKRKIATLYVNFDTGNKPEQQQAASNIDFKLTKQKGSTKLHAASNYKTTHTINSPSFDDY